MNLSLTPEQQMLDDAVRRFVEKGHDTANAPAARWAAFAELGLLGLMVPPEHGGLGHGAVEAYVVMRALGGAVVPEAYVSTALVGASLIDRAGSTAQKDRWLSAIVAGSLRFAIANEDNDDGAAPQGLALRGDRLYGRKSAVWGGDSADLLIAPSADGRLFCVDRRAGGVQVTPYADIDGRRSAEVEFVGVAVDASMELGEGAAALDHALDVGRAALCAEASGLLAALLDQTLEHLSTRRQFGQPLGSFQVLQHRAVDMLVAVELAHSAALIAAAGLASDSADMRRRQVSAAKAQVGQSIRQICEQAIQTFGGMGMTLEFAPTRAVRRLLAIDMTWGDRQFHIDRFDRTPA